MRFGYLTPFAFLALFGAGMRLGGAWTFAAAAATPACLAVLDAALGRDEVAPFRSGGEWMRWLPRAYVLLQLAANAAAAALILQPGTGWVESAGLALSAGVTTGVFGMVAAHELIHSRSAAERALGLTFFGSLFYAHFRIAHIHGHHVRAGTSDDPATARLGESLYRFLLRSVCGQVREAWSFEAERLRRRGVAAVSLRNRMLIYLPAEALFAASLALIDWRLLAFVLVVALTAVTLLESFNYVAHYGLARRTAADGSVERLGPHHSWNSVRRMNNAALFNMGRHSDHHRHMTRSFEGLGELPGSPDLPAGYAAALLTSLFPRLWRKVMDPRAKAAMFPRPPL